MASSLANSGSKTLTQRQILRFATFDSLLHWERRINATILADRMAETVSAMRKSLTQYVNHYPSGAIVYDTVEKHFRPTVTFAPRFAQGSIQEYVAFISRSEAAAIQLNVNGASIMPSHWLDQGPQYHHQPDPSVFSVITQAIREQRVLSILYASWQHPEGVWRTIHPHAVAQSHNRWHCRAFDDMRQEHRDFNLGRIIEFAPPPTGAVYIDGTNDKPWKTIVQVRLAPNPDLTEGAQAMVAREYNMGRDREITIPTRVSMIQYMLHALPVVDPREDRPENPKQRYLVVANPNDIQSGLF